MTRLSELVDEALAADLRAAIQRGEFPGLSYKHALEFLLSDGIVPAAGLPVASLLGLEDWARARAVAKR
ncbi:MAG: hypothetical protein ABI895_11770 [Deltaproteobacteria bacterium]